MSKHLFEVEVVVDEAALAEHNELAASGHAIPFDPDPSEWDGRDLNRAVDDLIAEIEVVNYTDLNLRTAR